MTLFWILSAALLLAAMLFVALPLWRKAAANNDVLRDAANLDILRDQSAELETDLRNGLLTQDAYEQGKRELQARLLEEVKTTEQPARPPRNPAKVLAIMLSVLLPIFSVSLYLKIGSPPQEPIVADADGIIRSADALQRMEKKLKRTPKNPDDWWTLARSYTELKRFPEAVVAYRQLVELVPDEAQLWVNYADAYAMAHGQTLQGAEVSRLLGKALELDANNISALALSGSAAMERGDYAAAITHWQKLINQVQPGSQEAQSYNGGIRQARELLLAMPGGKEKLAQLSAGDASAKAVTDPSAITGKISLSPALAGKVAPTDIVFILARAAQGPKMPLAVLRKQVKDLPLKFTLDDSMAMQPQLKLSGFDQVVVVARVSKSGTPTAQAGDLQGLSGTVKPGAKGLNIVIESVVP